MTTWRRFCAIILGRGAILHSFSSGPSLLRAALDLGHYVSFSGMVTFKNWRLDPAIREVPLDRLLVETDAPYLAPVPHRGRRNEPAFVRQVAERVAVVRGLPVRTVDCRDGRQCRSRVFGSRVGVPGEERVSNDQVPSDIEIAQAAKLRPIAEVAAEVGLGPDEILPYGRYKAKITRRSRRPADAEGTAGPGDRHQSRRRPGRGSRPSPSAWRRRCAAWARRSSSASASRRWARCSA